MIHKSITFTGNMNKIQTPIELTHYLHIIIIANNPILPILIMYVYLYIYICAQPWRKHTHDTPHPTNNKTNTHPSHFPLLMGDFNRDIFLVRWKNISIPTTSLNKPLGSSHSQPNTYPSPTTNDPYDIQSWLINRENIAKEAKATTNKISTQQNIQTVKIKWMNNKNQYVAIHTQQETISYT